jgi:hypothetical protein
MQQHGDVIADINVLLGLSTMDQKKGEPVGVGSRGITKRSLLFVSDSLRY